MPYVFFVNSLCKVCGNDPCSCIVLSSQNRGTDPKAAVGITKVPLHLNPGSAAAHQAMAHADGAKKYGPFNWRSTEVLASTYIAAIKRHVDAWFDGEDNSQDANVHHLGHAMAGLAIMLDAMECGTLVDDRPVKGAASAVQQRLIKKAD